ncbi:ParB N-terminal domain-containing protein [Pararoseomonas sp. SCSIO 73927]|uniref:ParB N-terminal domain-containing protein n=1 Tax=Pararoseomonas sp. SCSIO 73927 TaxID=3114537 RepID=UPI0030D2836F
MNNAQLTTPAKVIPLDLIEVGPRLRKVDPAWVTTIAESFQERGQDTPILVRPADVDGRFRLVAGGHRVPAAREAGWKTIEAKEFLGNDLEAELAEIDENLIRRELSELDRAAFLARRKEVWEELHPETKHGGKRRGDQVGKSDDLKVGRFTASAAATLGASEASIQRALRRYRELEPAVRARLSTTRFAHNGATLDTLTKLGPRDQAAVVDLLLDPAKGLKSVGEAIRAYRKTPDPDLAQVQLDKLRRTWDRCGNAQARRQFIEYLGNQGALTAPRKTAA